MADVALAEGGVTFAKGGNLPLSRASDVTNVEPYAIDVNIDGESRSC